MSDELAKRIILFKSQEGLRRLEARGAFGRCSFVGECTKIRLVELGGLLVFSHRVRRVGVVVWSSVVGS